MRCLIAFLLLFPTLLRADSGNDPASLCEWAAGVAAVEFGVPPDIMAALTLTETGRRHGGTVRPWAWSVNAEGAGSWFDDPDAALAFAEDRVARGRHNLDIGCFQLNYYWHGEHFLSVAEMFDPLNNARYAAGFVSRLHAEMGDWRRAAGAFHSRTPKHAHRYLARFDQIRAGLGPQGFGSRGNLPETYNSFASADMATVNALPQPSQQVRIVDRRMLLGAPPGTGVTGMPGSLAAIGGKRTALLSRGSVLISAGRGPLIGPGASPPVIAAERRRGRPPREPPPEGYLPALQSFPDEEPL
ncbi:hypothetical protein [Paracoccus aerodenitrificans]|uniref:hypothetical protein n=1 Tax=Paracoccus aerodenitrificans TaxID=3017781 RepID=UPI0022EFFB86|nr:hypothetical protein [Paracoccus aerodenitrificans]WBU63339.1 hypothetical protein PAE61_13360 [Paracoccus aerodenitrificans]